MPSVVTGETPTDMEGAMTGRDPIDEWGEDSFPASDPPASPMTHIGAPQDSAPVVPRPRPASRRAAARRRDATRRSTGAREGAGPRRERPH